MIGCRPAADIALIEEGWPELVAQIERLERKETISGPSKFVGFATTKPAPSVQRTRKRGINLETKCGGKRGLEPGSVQDSP